MKPRIAFLAFLLLATFQSFSQDTVKFQDLSSHVGEVVTFRAQAADFDSKTGHTYLYFGNRFPNQRFTVIVNRTNGKKKIKLGRDVVIGRQMTYFTGMVVKYTGEPDTTENYDIDAIKKYIETDRPVSIGGKPGMGHFNYNPRTVPVDLKERLVMIITEQKQIGKNAIYSKMSMY